MCVYATGSYARNEAGTHSDIDLFFVHEGSPHKFPVPRLLELRLFARVIEIGETMTFPTFSNDGEFLKVIFLEDMLEKMGGREDDSQNYFTARMLLLLESAPLVNEALYGEMLSGIVHAYFRDYPDHTADFRPVFLINDVIRFWKTLCLNYEHRRNRSDTNNSRRRAQQVKNFKLKFSRLMTCFGTVVAVCAKPSPIEPADILALTRLTPLERFLGATREVGPLADLREEIVRDYEWFLSATALTTEELHARFESEEQRRELFRRADVFGDRIYQALEYFAKRNGYRRYLVI